MAKLKDLKKLEKAINKLKEIAEEVKETLEEKRSWLDEKSYSYQESDKGQEWDEHLCGIESLLDEIDALEIPE